MACAVISKTELAEVKRQKDNLYKLILKKNNTKEKELMDLYRQTFIVANIDVLTPAEKKQFTKLSFR